MQDLTYLEGLVDALIPETALSVLDKIESIESFQDLYELLLDSDALDCALSGIGHATQDITTYQLTKLLWVTLPFPARGFRPGQWQTPTAFKRCVCGSGKRENACCNQLSVNPNFDSEDLIRHIAQDVSSSTFQKWSKLTPPAWLKTIIAQRWINEKRFKKALKVIAPLHAQLAELSLHLSTEIVDQTILCLEHLGYHNKLESFVQQQLNSACPHLRSNILQRQALLAASRGMHRSAEALLTLARTETPNQVGLIPLELVILLGKGDLQTMIARSRYWYAWSKKHLPTNHPITQFTAEVVHKPSHINYLIDTSHPRWSLPIKQILSNASTAQQLSGQSSTSPVSPFEKDRQQLEKADNDEI